MCSALPVGSLSFDHVFAFGFNTVANVSCVRDIRVLINNLGGFPRLVAKLCAIRSLKTKIGATLLQMATRARQTPLAP